MKEIRLHGRGGQGAVTAAEIIAGAFVIEGKYATCFPMFGFERRGAPLAAFVRFDDRQIRLKTQIYTPDCVVVTDQSLVKSPQVYAGLKPSGSVVLNSRQLDAGKLPPNEKAAVLDATTIALEEMKVPITNTTMVGAFAAATGWLSLPAVLESLGDFFSGELLKKNRKCAERGYNEVRLVSANSPFEKGGLRGI